MKTSVKPRGRRTGLLHQLYRFYLQAPEHPGKMRPEGRLAACLFPLKGVPYRVKAGVRLFLHPVTLKKTEEELFQKMIQLGYDLFDLKGREVHLQPDLIEANVVAVRHGKEIPSW